MTTSATGGYLVPAASPAPLEDDAFTDFLQAIVVGLTGLQGANVRPRWQPQVPNLPPDGDDWAAIGIQNTTPDTYAVEIHDATGSGRDELQRHEIVEILISFYGPHANRYCGMLRDGLQIAQNREVLFRNGMGLVDTGPPTPAPSLVKDRWLYRVDMMWTIKRAVQRFYPVLNVLSAQGAIITELSETSIVVNP